MIANPATQRALRVTMQRPEQRLERYRILLSQTSVFRGVDPAALEDLARRVQVRTRVAQSIVVAEDEPSDATYVLVAGRAKVVLCGESGRELLLRALDPGDVFGKMAPDDDQARSASVVAIDDVTMMVLDREGLRAHLVAHPATAVQLLGEVSRWLRQADETVANLALFDVEARLARTLERLAVESETGSERCVEGIWLAERPTQQELANMVGSCRETISRTFTSLARRGLLVQRGRAMLITTELLRRAGRRPQLVAV